MATIITYNGTQIASTDETAPVAVTYGGSTIASIAEGTTKTLNCSGKYMTTNVVVGSKTLNCANKIMSGNVVVEVQSSRDYIADLIAGSLPAVYENDLVTNIGQYGMAYHASLQIARFPNVTNIESYAFADCTNLIDVYIGTNTNTVCSLAGSASNTIFNGCTSLQHIYVPSSLLASYQADSYWASLSDKLVGV